MAYKVFTADMNFWDFAVIAAYLLCVTVIGILLRKKSRQTKEDYLMGGKRLPWWLLGISNASGMFDISGTIWMVSIMFVYGVKSIWLPWLWPVFNQVFMFVYLSIWLRRSNASTGAEWMETRFGKRATGAQRIIIVFALLSCLSFMAYGFIGLGKFVEIFIPFSSISPFLPFSIPADFVPHFYGIIFTLFAVFYAILGGMSSIVWADLVQYSLMALGAFCIALFAISELRTHDLIVPEGWKDLHFQWDLGVNWEGILPEVNKKIEEDGFHPFGLFFTLMFTKGILSSLAGPAPNYDMQKILSTRNPKEAALMSMFVNVVLLPTRYLMIIGFTVLALLYYPQLDLQTASGEVDFEKILPSTILKFAPAGLLGLFLVELLSAFMGTFAGTLNAAQAYIVNDIYLRFKKDRKGNLQKVHFLSGLGVVSLSIFLGLFAKDVNSILQWIVGALYAGFISANVLKWHWWRFNGTGYAVGMAVGILCAMVFPYLFPDTLPLYYFPLILALSFLGGVLGSYSSPATDRNTLKAFYSQVNPWGFWKPIEEEVRKDSPDFAPNPDFKKDMGNVTLGILAQTAITALPVFLVLWMWKEVAITSLLLGICVVTLFFTWYKKLPNQ
ncbi:sodium:solute symporter family protein [Leadbetterella byssophila]|uniref:sodium:solute symporter family protein n=1 Tax=Leadbetterella byssophila TaxID=316068 RepID=UPI0039A235B1